MSFDHKNILQSKIQEYKRKYYLSLTVRGLIISLAFISTVYVCFAIFEHYAQTGSTVRTILFYSFLTALLVTAGIWVIKPIAQLYNLGSDLTDESASQQIGNYFPSIKDKLLNTLQLSSVHSSDNHLLQATINQRTRELSVFSFKDAIDIKDNRRFLKWIIFPGTIIAVILLSNANILKDGTSRLLNHRADLIPQAPFEFNIDESSLQTFSNENFVLNLELNAKNQENALPNQVDIIINGQKRTMKKIDASHYSYDFGSVNSDLHFQFEAATFKSKAYSVSVVNRPKFQTFSANLDYPNYLGKKDEQLENAGSLTVPEGTKIKWLIKSTDTDSLFITFDGKKELAQKIDQNTFSFSKTARQSNSYTISIKNQYGSNREKILYHLNVIKDEYPAIQLEQYQDTVLFKYLLLGGNMTDDYGISQAKFYYSVIDEDGKPKSDGYKSQNISIKYNQNNQSFFHQLELDSLLVDKGQAIEYYVQVWDNDGFNGPKSSKSRKFKFHMPDEKQIKENLEKSFQTSENQIDKALEKARDVKKEIDKLHEKIKSKKQVDWQDKKRIEDLLKDQQQLQKEVEQMQENFKEQTKKSERFNKEDQQLKQKAKMLQKLMDELMDEETKKLYEELQKLLNENVKQEQIEKLLDQMKDKDEVAEKELERALEMFKQLKFEQKLKESVEELKKLAEDQEKLSEQSKDKKSDTEELKEKQEELKDKFDDIKKDIEELEKLNESLSSPNDMDKTEEEQKSIDQKIQQSQESLEKGKKSQAGDNQKDAADEMKNLAQKMDEMQQSMQSEQMEEDLNALREILENLITLSYDQEELMVDFKKVNQADPRFLELSQKQLKLQDDAQIIEDSLYSLAKRVFEIESFVTREVTAMNHNMDKSVEAIKQRNPGKASGEQQQAMTSMNNLALLLDDVMQQMQQQMGQQKAGDQMCNKPGNGKPGKSGQPKLGDMQKSLNQMIEQIKNGGKSGRALSEELAKLAAQQEAIRRALQQMESEMKKNGQKDGSGLGELQKQMEKTEEDIVNKQITPETLQRQKDILTRLLEAEKSIRERDYEDKRESEKSKEKERNTPPDFEKYIRTKEKQIELLKTIPPSLTPYYKKEVNEYFQKIEN